MKVQVCMGKVCSDKFSKYIKTRLENDKERLGYDTLIIEESPCMGECKCGPNISIDGHKEKYVTPAKASELVGNKMNKKNVKNNNNIK